ncbi:MAG TPA: MFS transporter [Actinomycetota bacterium]|nr:MFS transporter [Actinomycetota bacterium]
MWQLVLLGAVRAAQGLVTHPLRRMWRSADPIDAYALNHMTSVAGDALLAVALADSVFFSLPVGESRVRAALFLALTMLPLALAGPVLVPILDRAGPRRWVTIVAAAARAVLVLILAERVDEPVAFVLVLAILVLAKVHAVSKNALTMAYANREDGLLRANARLGRIAVVGALVAAPLGYLVLTFLGVSSPLYVAAIVYAASALLAMRLPQPLRLGAAARVTPAGARVDGPRGSLPHLAAPAIGAIGLRAAGGFLIFLLAFALRSAEVPAYWFAVLAAAGVVGGFLVDLTAPTLPRSLREESIVVVCISAAGVGAVLASQLFGLPLLAIYAFIAGAATELARLAMQSLVQRDAPADALGRVFVRYEALYQVAWVGAACIPTVLPISFRQGMLVLVAFYAVLGAAFWWRWRRALDPRAGP